MDRQQSSPYATPKNKVPRPAFRRLRGYAFDPSLSIQMDTALVNEVVFKVPWEETGVGKGPVGEYLEVVDYDPASGCFYEPVDLDDPYVLGQDGLPPSEGTPQFHQQMVYAVAMTTIANFERALGRWALWSAKKPGDKEGKGEFDQFVRRLRVYPHALREPNAYYSPTKRALLFGYFPAPEQTDKTPEGTSHFPGGWVFTCLSHDVIAHETTHALLDGMHKRYIERTHPDTLAFHEAFADIVALLQHFSFPEVLRHQIAKTRGDLKSQNMLGQLAQQFGRAMGQHGALRDAIGGYDDAAKQWRPHIPDPDELTRTFEPHARGAILVAAVFDAFQAIYRGRVADLYRIATSGTGVLQDGELHPDLVNRLAGEASKSAKHVLQMCIRALDYCPPVDINFGDYLRAIITADTDLVPDDDLGYRVAFIEAFRRRGIYPRDVRTLSVDSLRWAHIMRGREGDWRIIKLTEVLNRHLGQLRDSARTREDYFRYSQNLASTVHKLLTGEISVEKEFGEALESIIDKAVYLTTRDDRLKERTAGGDPKPVFEVHSVRAAQRVGPDGDSVNHLVAVILQKRAIPASGTDPAMDFRGGTTLIFNLKTFELQYAISKEIMDDRRVARQREFQRTGKIGDLWSTYFKRRLLELGGKAEHFAMLHRELEELEP